MQMQATFKKIQFALMVGIRGGVPSAETDYDIGKTTASEFERIGKTTASEFERTGALNSPLQMLLAAVAKVRANKLRGRSKLREHVSKLEGIRKFQSSKAGPNVLFKAAYSHGPRS
ncbi:hypothetical protein EJ02DRAFT_438070 [Clathrospora elynae]|uniref:Uncharacterized protein n=1 Tax=Clathrospora elynae TaxID=706981 RepID=A0A6A5S951_9PLEO|nr:hypothetical protein EJ02DRAFT_438070 [Clathrospora elynae]